MKIGLIAVTSATVSGGVRGVIRPAARTMTATAAAAKITEARRANATDVSSPIRHSQMVSRASLLRAVHEIANAVFVFVLPHDLSWSGRAKLAGIGAAALAIAALALAGRPTLPAGPARAAVVQWMVCLAVFGGVFAGCGVPLEIVGHLIVVAPSTMLVAFVFTSAASRRQRWTGAVAALVFTGFALTQLWSHYHSPAGILGEWQRVAATLAAGDRSIPVAVFPAELALPLNVYLPVTAIAIPVPMPFTLDYVGATTLTGEPDVARVLDPVGLRSNRLWLVTAGACDGRPNAYDYRCALVRGFGMTLAIALANPADIVLFAALFAGLGIVVQTPLQHALFYAAICAGGCAYWIALILFLDRWRARVQLLNRACSALMFVGAGASLVSLVRAAH
jgi:hypothetical protein